MNIITIDCGASFIKGALFENGIMIKQIQKCAPPVGIGVSIMNPVQIQALISMVKLMIEELAVGKSEIGLCISNEMHGFILCYEDGEPYTDYISWQKEYGKIQVNRVSAVQILSAERYADDILNTGMPLRAGLPSCNLLFLSLSGKLKNTERKLYFYTLGDYILRIISGKEPMCHPTNAAASGLYDLRTGNWNHRLINAVRAEHIIFPVIGTREIIFTMQTMQVHALPAVGDQQAALLGAGLEKEQDLSFNLGTGAQVSKLVQELIYSAAYQIRPYFNHMYLKTIPYLPSGRALNVYVRFFQDILKHFQVEITSEELWKELLKAEKECSGTDLQCDMSFFENAVSDHSVGCIANIREYGLDLGSLMRGIFEQMGKNYIWAANIIEPEVKNVRKIIFSGGLARKIESIRKEIMVNYPQGVKVIITSNETLIGLYQYGNQRGLI